MAVVSPDQKVKLNVHEGTTLTLGISSIFRTTAVRRSIVRNLDNDDQDLFDAIFAAWGRAGSVHHSISTLPLSEVRAVKFGIDKAYVDLVYRHTRGSLPPQGAQLMAAFESTYDHVEVFRRINDAGGNPQFDQFGLPNGLLNGEPPPITDPKNPPTPWIWKRPTLRMIVPTVLFSSPYVTNPVLANLPGTTNVDEIVFQGQALPGIPFAPNTVRFNGTRVEWLGSSFFGAQAPAKYKVQYDFTAIAGEWKRQVLTGDHPIPQTTWQTETEDMYLRAPFANQFPVHPS